MNIGAVCTFGDSQRTRRAVQFHGLQRRDEEQRDRVWLTVNCNSQSGETRETSSVVFCGVKCEAEMEISDYTAEDIAKIVWQMDNDVGGSWRFDE